MASFSLRIANIGRMSCVGIGGPLLMTNFASGVRNEVRDTDGEISRESRIGTKSLRKRRPGDALGGILS